MSYEQFYAWSSNTKSPLGKDVASDVVILESTSAIENPNPLSSSVLDPGGIIALPEVI